MYSVKLSNSGNVIWNKLYDSTQASQCNDIYLDSGNNYLSCGFVEYSFGYILKFDLNGNKKWQKNYSAGYARSVNNIIEFNNSYLTSGVKIDTLP